MSGSTSVFGDIQRVVHLPQYVDHELARCVRLLADRVAGRDDLPEGKVVESPDPLPFLIHHQAAVPLELRYLGRPILERDSGRQMDALEALGFGLADAPLKEDFAQAICGEPAVVAPVLGPPRTRSLVRFPPWKAELFEFLVDPLTRILDQRVESLEGFGLSI